MSISARRELAASQGSRYRKAKKKVRTQILDEFVEATGLNRKYAMTVLARPPGIRVRKSKARSPKYGPDVRRVLEELWAVSGFVCSKRLVPFLPQLMAMMEAASEQTWQPETQEKVLALSPATCDRLLHAARHAYGAARGKCLTRPGTLLKAQIPIKTWADWNEAEPGFCEMDLVHHCGDSTAGEYLHTLTLTDVATGWTENYALANRSQRQVLCGLEAMLVRFPFPIRGLDSDSGSEFINEMMLRYCQERKITFTRSRPYRKNDSCFVEQKNWSVVRQNVGYDRLEGQDACNLLNAFYRALRLQVNYLQPTLKLESKTRIGPKVVKRYHPAQTPAQRMLAQDNLKQEERTQIEEQLAAIQPRSLANEINRIRIQLYTHAK